MSAFHGPQGKGAMKARRGLRRRQAEERHALYAAAPAHAAVGLADPRPCRKKRYATEQEALEVLTDAKIGHTLHRKVRRREIRHYACPACLGWHLSSRPYNPIKPEAA